MIELNKFQTPIEELKYRHVDENTGEITHFSWNDCPEEVREEFNEHLATIPFIHSLIKKSRPYCKDLPRDEKGRAIWNIIEPPIIEDTEYFRQTAIHYQETGRLTDFRPNPNPGSAYRKWADTELDRIYNGMLRESDGAWIPGDMYWFLNYSPIVLTKLGESEGVGDRVTDMPLFWEGILWRFIGWYDARRVGQNFAEIAKRGASKSFTMASKLSKTFILGNKRRSQEDIRAKKPQNARGVIAAYQKEFLQKDGTLNKFEQMVDFCATNTQFPRKKLQSSLNDMSWEMGYVDLNTGAKLGTRNTIVGVAVKDDIDKMRGKRSEFIGFEEFGKFPNLSDMYRTTLPSVKEGNLWFGMIALIGTGGEEGADFSSALDMIYHPAGFFLRAYPNVWDKSAQTRGTSIFFFPAYVNRPGCYNKDGISDVTKALFELCCERYIAKYHNPDPMQITRTKAEDPVTIQDAIMRRDGTLFPVAQISERIQEIDLNPKFFDDILVGKLVQSSGGNVEFKPTGDTPIRKFPTKDNKVEGAIEIAKLPEKNKEGKVYPNRYVMSCDPIDTDNANTMSLVSAFVLDLWTDKLVCEWTGRFTYTEDCYEVVRLINIFYNAKLLYEAHPYSQIVHTPDGDKLWKDIKIGDSLFSPDGSTVRVTDIPIDEYMPIYEIVLGDGRKVQASDNHLWSVYTMEHRDATVLMTTKEMMAIGAKNKHGQSRFFIPKSNMVEYKSIEVPIEPYTMGLLLAEGCFVPHHCHKNSVQISNKKEDLLFYKKIIPYDIEEKEYDEYNSLLRIPGCREILKSLNLFGCKSEDKFIPDIYKFNSSKVRIALLRGLMDGDGYAGRAGASIYITKSKALAEDIMSLCRSLGINCSSKYNEITKNNRKYSHYRVNIYTEDKIFELPRKVTSMYKYSPEARGSKAKAYIEKTAITSIEFSHYEMGKCVTVSSDSGLYLIGDYVVTHNCNKKGLYSYYKQKNCLYLLAETPQFLKDRDMVKASSIGNSIYGVNATIHINAYARARLKDWMLKPVEITVMNDDGEREEKTIPNVMTWWNRAALDEARQWNPDGNFDRISSLGMLMLIREERYVEEGGEITPRTNYVSQSKANDPFFERNYRDKKR